MVFTSAEMMLKILRFNIVPFRDKSLATELTVTMYSNQSSAVHSAVLVVVSSTSVLLSTFCAVLPNAASYMRSGRAESFWAFLFVGVAVPCRACVCLSVCMSVTF